jgi:signal transduction histidine kinase
MKSLRRIFEKLHWKLTASYIVVTVGSLLFIVIIISIPLFTYILSPIDILDPDYWVEEIYAGKYVEFIRQFLAQSPPDVFGVGLLVNNLDVLTESRYEVFKIRDIILSITTAPQLEGAVVDEKGSLLSATSGELGESIYNPEPFRSRAFPEINGILQAALEGETEIGKLSAKRENEYLLFLVIPVYEKSNSLNVIPDDKLLGVIVIVVKSLPSQEFLPTYITRIIGTSLVWFLVAAGVVGELFGFITAKYFEKRIKNLYTAADHWSQGEFTETVKDTSADELGQLADRMNQMAVQLQGLLTERQEIAVSEERNRLARELHDSAKQQAFAAAFQLGAAISKLDRDADKNEIRNKLLETQNSINKIQKELTDLIHELRPPDVQGRSLQDSVQNYVVEWAHQNDVEVFLDIEPDKNLTLDQKLALYRVVQEAISNIAKHSQATKVEIRLIYLERKIQLDVSDDGVGFDVNQPRKGMGLNFMKERVESLDGKLEVISQSGKGSQIRILLPMSNK